MASLQGLFFLLVPGAAARDTAFAQDTPRRFCYCNRDMRNRLTFILPFIGLCLFVYIVGSTGPAAIAAVLRSADVGGAGVAVLLLPVIFVLRGLRWKLLLGIAGIDLPLWRAVVVWMIGFAAGTVTPGKAGDAIRAFYLRAHTGRSLGEAFFTVFVDRLYDLVFVLVLGVVSILLFSRLYIQIPSVWVLVISTALLVASLYLAMNRRLMRRLLRPLFEWLVPARHKDGLALNVHTFYDTMAVYARAPGRLVVAGLLTVAGWAVIFALAWRVAAAFGTGVPFGYVFLIMPMVTLVEVLPVTISGLGTRDAAVIYFFSVVGVSSAAAVAFSLGYLVLGNYVAALAGFVMWLRHPLRGAGVRAAKQSESS